MARGRSHKRKTDDGQGRDEEKPNITGPALKKQKRDEDRKDGELPRKKFYRQRAHANPFSDHALTYPLNPQAMDWSIHYPAFVDPQSDRTGEEAIESARPPLQKQVEVADIGCGFGGLLFALAPKLPDTLILGMEIRSSVTEFVDNKIKALRQQQLPPAQVSSDPQLSPPHNANLPLLGPAEDTVEAPAISTQLSPPGAYSNISVIRANAMKFLPNFFVRGQLHSIYLCFPDPHFKQRKHKARIVSPTLNSEYAFVLRPGGLVYTITDVEDLSDWMSGHFDGHELFERLPEAQMTESQRVGWDLMHKDTEEGKKVERNQGKKFAAVWRRRDDPLWLDARNEN